MNPTAAKTPIRLDQHALLVGINGSGKSTRMEMEAAWRLSRMQRFSPQVYKFIIVDTKPISYGQSDDLGHYSHLGGTIYRDWADINLAKEENRLIIYRPTNDLVNPENFSEFFNRILSYRYRASNGTVSPLPMTVVIDELIDIITSETSRRTYIEGFTKMLVQGRSALQTLWILTQYPVYIDPSIKRNARVNYVFRLPDESDRKIMAGILGFKEAALPIRSRHGFWYQSDAIDSTLSRPWYFDGKGAPGASVVPLRRLA